MARSRALIPTSIWRRPDFVAMNAEPQWLYLTLCTQPHLSQAGVLPLTLNRWASMSTTTTPADIKTSLSEMQDAGYAAIDYGTEEVAVRRLVPPAGYKQLQGAMADTTRINSPRLRLFALDQLNDMGHDSHRATAAERRGFPAMRIRVYTRDRFMCRRCSWAPHKPDGYDGRHALGEISLDATGDYRVRVLELDHIHPKSRGGAFTFANLQTLCSACNASKGASV
ncbi:HNH endonuclease [Micromonospora tulbaghiae]|uniref:HNH endonuclease n=1 Tax=Micromonospora tulbaghiae TaxID=479978 RepID=UPI0033B5AFA3